MGRPYDEFIPKYYMLDPETEDLLFDGSKLRDGMVVVVADPAYRVPILEEMNDEALYLARMLNRFAKISNLVLQFLGDPDRVTFIATYDDGHKVKVTHPMEWAWIVKKNSVNPEAETPNAVMTPERWAAMKEHEGE
jgi:hypothetical protein